MHHFVDVMGFYAISNHQITAKNVEKEFIPTDYNNYMHF